MNCEHLETEFENHSEKSCGSAVSSPSSSNQIRCFYYYKFAQVYVFYRFLVTRNFSISRDGGVSCSMTSS
uniref:Uncharacterized protein n=1 Tax=Romanomermis culicivorax TaxID=13658 RepID=A0A915LB72_ROMCU